MYNYRLYGTALRLHIICSRSSARPQHLEHPLRHHPPRTQVVDLLRPLHPLRSQDHEDGVLEQEVAHQQSAKLIVVPLLAHLPDPALGLVELGDQPQAALVSVVANLLLQQRLVEVEARNTVALPLGREPLEQHCQQVARFVALLHEAYYLVDLVGNHIPVLVLVQPLPAHLLLLPVRVVVPVHAPPPRSPTRPATALNPLTHSRLLHFYRGMAAAAPRLSVVRSAGWVLGVAVCETIFEYVGGREGVGKVIFGGQGGVGVGERVEDPLEGVFWEETGSGRGGG